jgi:arginase
MARKIQLILNESEVTAGTRGASLGPKAVKVAAWKKQSSYFAQFENCIEIENNETLLNNPIRYPFSKRIHGLVSVFAKLNVEIEKIIVADDFPLIIAADHGSAGGTIAALKTAMPSKKIGVVWIDAHGDLHTPFTTPSGNMHGMPLATALGVDNVKCAINEPSQESLRYWNDIKNFGGISPKINPEDLVFIAVRDTEEPEDKLMEELQLRNFKVDEVRRKGVDTIVKEVLQKVNHCDVIYISFDVDSMDPDIVSYGTGTPVANGLTPEESKQIMAGLINSGKVCCLEFVEINPCLDEKKNKMAEVAFELLEELTPLIQANL